MRYSYGWIQEEAARHARQLVDGGLQSGDRVAICLDNSIDAIVWMFAVLMAGGVFFIVGARTRAERVAELLADSGAAVVVDGDGWRTLKIRQTGRPIADLAALVYTSGSTGTPKGVMLTHDNLAAAAASICSYLELTDRDVILSVLPLAFTYGLGQVTTAFAVGATLVLERSLTYPRATLELMARERVTGLPIVPTIATVLLQQTMTGVDLSALRYITNAAAALTIPKLQRLRAVFPNVRIYSMYGQTECQRVSYLPPTLLGEHPDSVGVPIPGMQATVVDEHGADVPAGVIGELAVCGPTVMAGYWNRPEETARALRPRGPDGALWLHTGDLFRRDENGLLYFVERNDSMLKCRGEKVAPHLIEEVIAQLPGVAEAAVYGVPDELVGDAIIAVVTPCPDVQLTAAQVQRHCLARLDSFMVPTRVDIRAALPTTTTGKIDRRQLRDTAPRSGSQLQCR